MLLRVTIYVEIRTKKLDVRDDFYVCSETFIFINSLLRLRSSPTRYEIILDYRYDTSVCMLTKVAARDCETAG